MYNRYNLPIFPKFCKVTVTKRASNSCICRLAHFVLGTMVWIRVANLDETPSAWVLARLTNSRNSLEQTFSCRVLQTFYPWKVNTKVSQMIYWDPYFVLICVKNLNR